MHDLEQRVRQIERPAPRLLTHYFLRSLFVGPLFPFLFIPLFLRYRTLRYAFDAQGVSMRWGILFRREINLTYARIQDIHLRSGIVERHLGLARIDIQTASGSAKAEMTIEGLLEFEAVRDYLYARMRGQRPESDADPLAATLTEIAAEVRALRRELQDRAS